MKALSKALKKFKFLCEQMILTAAPVTETEPNLEVRTEYVWKTHEGKTIAIRVKLLDLAVNSHTFCFLFEMGKSLPQALFFWWKTWSLLQYCKNYFRWGFSSPRRNERVQREPSSFTTKSGLQVNVGGSSVNPDLKTSIQINGLHSNVSQDDLMEILSK